MLMVLSPAKTLDFEPASVSEFSVPEHMDDTWQLVRKMRKFSAKSIKKMMSVSDKLAELNKARFDNFATPTEPEATAKQALLAFKGDTYRDMALDDWTADDYAFAQERLRILSGLYGVLRPLDLIRPYRLEMGTSVKTPRGGSLYAFWGDTLAQGLAEQLEALGTRTVLNLASNEYFKSVGPHLKKAATPIEVIDVAFLDAKNGAYKTISFFAKRARGAMASWVVRERITEPQGLAAFDVGGYIFDKDESSPSRLVFKRDAG